MSAPRSRSAQPAADQMESESVGSVTPSVFSDHGMQPEGRPLVDSSTDDELLDIGHFTSAGSDHVIHPQKASRRGKRLSKLKSGGTKSRGKNASQFGAVQAFHSISRENDSSGVSPDAEPSHGTHAMRHTGSPGDFEHGEQQKPSKQDPTYVPHLGMFYMHDDRRPVKSSAGAFSPHNHFAPSSPEMRTESTTSVKGHRRDIRSARWSHDRFDNHGRQAPGVQSYKASFDASDDLSDKGSHLTVVKFPKSHRPIGIPHRYRWRYEYHPQQQTPTPSSQNVKVKLPQAKSSDDVQGPLSKGSESPANTTGSCTSRELQSARPVVKLPRASNRAFEEAMRGSKSPDGPSVATHNTSTRLPLLPSAPKIQARHGETSVANHARHFSVDARPFVPQLAAQSPAWQEQYPNTYELSASRPNDTVSPGYFDQFYGYDYLHMPYSVPQYPMAEYPYYTVSWSGAYDPDGQPYIASPVTPSPSGPAYVANPVQ